jgi:streptogramin lyase
MRQLHKHLINNPLIISGILTLAAIVLLIPIVVHALGPTFTEYSLSDGQSNPTSIVTGPDGNLWFTEMGNNTIGKITTSGTISEFSIPLNGAASTDPSDITTGPDGNMWFTEESANRIGKISPTSDQISQYQLPGSLIEPSSIVTGPDGNMWFTVFGSNIIGVMSTSGTLLHQYNSDVGSPDHITLGSDGNMWYVINGEQLVRMTPSTGIIPQIADVGTSGSILSDLVTGPDGDLWFTISNSQLVGKMNPSSWPATQYTTSAGSDPISIVGGPDGNMWFTEENCGLATVNISTGSITQYASPTTGLYGIAKGTDNNIWYTVSDNYSRIGKAVLGTLGAGTPCSTSTTPPNGGTTSSGTSGSGSSGSTSGSGSTGSSSGSSGAPPVTLPPAPGGGSTNSGDVIKTIIKNGVTIATVDPGINLAHYSYVVPDKQLLYVDGTLGQVIVQKGATLKGGGVIMELTVESGGTLAPGHSPGCITSNDITMSGTYSVQIGGATPCSDYDQVVVSKSITLNGDLAISGVNGFDPQPGQVFTIIKNGGRSPINGSFAGLPEGAKFSNQGVNFQISYKGGSGHDVTLTVLKLASYKAPVGVSGSPVVSKRVSVFSKYLPEIVVVAILLLAAALFAYLHLMKSVGNKAGSTAQVQLLSSKLILLIRKIIRR